MCSRGGSTSEHHAYRPIILNDPGISGVCLAHTAQAYVYVLNSLVLAEGNYSGGWCTQELIRQQM